MARDRRPSGLIEKIRAWRSGVFRAGCRWAGRDENREDDDAANHVRTRKAEVVAREWVFHVVARCLRTTPAPLRRMSPERVRQLLLRRSLTSQPPTTQRRVDEIASVDLSVTLSAIAVQGLLRSDQYLAIQRTMLRPMTGMAPQA